MQSISCGYFHSMALTVNGNVYSWVRKVCGQFGVKGNVKSLYPQLIVIKDKTELFKQISCGDGHSLLLTTNGDIYSFGNNENYQLGYETKNSSPNGDSKQLIPRMIETNPRLEFSHICTQFLANFSTAFSSTDNSCYFWGKFGSLTIEALKRTTYKSCEQLFSEIQGITIKSEKFPIKYFKTFLKTNFLETEFKNIELLSNGSYGKVYKAVETRNNEIKAIKQLNYSGKNLFNERILNEIQFMSQLRSEYVVQYGRAWIERNKNPNDINDQYFLYIEMELCLKTLKEFNKQLLEDLNCSQSLCENVIGLYIMSAIIKEIIEGVRFLHINEIIHRDLKPQNILITELKNGRIVRIADFGISCVHEIRNTDNEFEGISHTGDAGDLDYMAPELCKWTDRESGRLIYDNKVDIYSMGKIFAEFVGNSDINQTQIQTNAEFMDLMKTKINNLRENIEKMINKNPEDRPDCDELLKDSNNYLINLSDLNQYKQIEAHLKIPKTSSLTNVKNFHTEYIEKKLCHRIIYNANSDIKFLFSTLFGIEIAEFNVGLFHCIARAVDGKLYSFGSNDFKQLGYEIENKLIDRPNIIESLENENIIQVSCGYRHTIVLTQNGEIFGWGENTYGSIRAETSNTNQSIPIKIHGFNGEKIKSISCGSWHSISLTVNGNVFGWGNNSCGQLGINTTVDSHIPQMVDMNDKNILFKRISCGENHSLILSTNGDIYSFGSNKYSELGYETSGYQIIPRIIEINPRIDFSYIFCDWSEPLSTAIALEDSFCYIWGTVEENVIKYLKTTDFKKLDQFFKQKLVNFDY